MGSPIETNLGDPTTIRRLASVGGQIINNTGILISSINPMCYD